MRRSKKAARTVRAWTALPRALRRASAGLTREQLSWRPDAQSLSVQHWVHHLVEANLVAANIVLAALGNPGARFDWSWVQPNGAWMERMRYDQAPLEPALALCEALCAHVAMLLDTVPDGLRRHVRLLDAPGAKLRRRTVEQVLADETAHARMHLREVAHLRRALRAASSGRRPHAVRERRGKLRITR